MAGSADGGLLLTGGHGSVDDVIKVASAILQEQLADQLHISGIDVVAVHGCSRAPW